MDQLKTGKLLAALRKEKNLTQEALGEKLGVTNKTISRWETGAYMPDIDKLQELSSILGVSVNELLCGERITDENLFAKKADENLIAALSESNAFGLQDRISFFKRKWVKEHKWTIGMSILLFIFIVAAAVVTKHPAAIVLVPLCGLSLYMLIYNRMMAYVEQNAFRK